MRNAITMVGLALGLVSSACGATGADAEQIAARRVSRRAARQSEIEQLDPRLRPHDVARLQIAVHDAVAMGFVERINDLYQRLQRLRGWNGPAPNAIVERLSIDVIHD